MRARAPSNIASGKDALRMMLADRLAACSHDELRAVGAFVQRIEKGRIQYGPLVLADDKRDWLKERREEMLDLVAYTIFAELAGPL